MDTKKEEGPVRMSLWPAWWQRRSTAAVGTPWVDLAVVVIATALAAALAVHYEMSETLRALTQPGERFQLDELPGVMLVLAIGLIWFAWRRYQDARLELRRRLGVESRLANALVDNRMLAQQYVRVQESEWRSLARELHDELGQYLNAIKIDAVGIRRAAAGNNPDCERGAVSIVSSVDHVHVVVTDMIRRLRPVGLDELGLAAALEHCVNGWRRRLEPTRIVFEAEPDLEQLGELLNVTVFRLVQEGLTNVSKHAHANHVEVRVARARRPSGERVELVVSVRDDGVGTNTSQRTGGLGLVGMRERVEALGGQLALHSAPGKGFSFTAHLPLETGDESNGV